MNKTPSSGKLAPPRMLLTNLSCHSGLKSWMGRITEITEAKKIPIKAMEAQRKALATGTRQCANCLVLLATPAGVRRTGHNLQHHDKKLTDQRQG